MFLHCLIVFFVSMVPLIELRGAVPIGVGMGLPELLTLAIAVVGNMVPVPLIFLFSRRVLERGQDKRFIGKFCSWCLKKGHRGGAKLKAKTGDNLYFALFLFVGIPVPGTGAWTGTLAASILDLDFKKSVTAVLMGVVLAGVIMLGLSLGVVKLLT